MKKSDLFKKFEIKNNELPTTIGGFYTSVNSDTNLAGENNDIIHETKNSNGESLGNDAIITNGDLDAPFIE